MNENKRSSWVGGLMVAAAAALWGTFSLYFRNAERFAHEAGASISPATESFVFFGVVLIVLGPGSLRTKVLSPPTKSAWLWMAFFSVGDAANVLLYFAAMQATTVAVAVLTHYLAPIFLALLAPLVLKERSAPGLWTAVVGAFLGLALLLEPHRAEGAASWWGAVLGTGSALLFAGAMMAMKRLGRWFSSSQVLCLHYPGALFVLYLFIPEGELLTLPWQSWALLVLSGLLPGALGGWLFVEGIRRLPASRAGVLTLIEPVVAVTVGMLFWNESPGWVAACGGALVLLSAYRVIRADSGNTE